MERTADGEQTFYRFGETDVEGHAASTAEGFNRVTAEEYSVSDRYRRIAMATSGYTGPSLTKYVFGFKDDTAQEGPPWEGGGTRFLVGYGIDRCLRKISTTDHPLFENDITAVRAVLGGTAVEYEDALIPTSSSSSSWGEVKQQGAAR